MCPGTSILVHGQASVQGQVCVRGQQRLTRQSEGAERSFTVPGCVAEVEFRGADCCCCCCRSLDNDDTRAPQF
eukprot:9486631-Pyramimonas_sp.AAC.1